MMMISELYAYPSIGLVCNNQVAKSVVGHISVSWVCALNSEMICN